MRVPGAALALLLLTLTLAGCTTFTPYTTSNLPEVRATFSVEAYDSDANNRTDGIAIKLLSSQPPPPLVGSDVIFDRNGDTNVTVWRCPQRDSRLCQSNRGLLSWDVNEFIYLRGLPGINRLQLAVRERFIHNTSLQVDETRDTEVWAVIHAAEYDSDGNGTKDAIEVSLVDSDKAPFAANEVEVLVNKVPQTLFTNSRLTSVFEGSWLRGQKLFIDGFAGVNRLEVFVKATRYQVGDLQLGE